MCSWPFWPGLLGPLQPAERSLFSGTVTGGLSQAYWTEQRGLCSLLRSLLYALGVKFILKKKFETWGQKDGLLWYHDPVRMTDRFVFNLRPAVLSSQAPRGFPGQESGAVMD